MVHDVTILWLITATLIIMLMVILNQARDLSLLRRTHQENTLLLRRLAEALSPGSTKDVPVTTDEEGGKGKSASATPASSK